MAMGVTFGYFLNLLVPLDNNESMIEIFWLLFFIFIF